MPIDVVMPKLGLTMATGTIARWIKHPGDAVRAGEPLLEVSTDKISYEIEAPASGTMVRAMGDDGAEFACGDVIGVIAVAGESETPVPPRVPHDEPAPAPSAATNGAAAAGGRTVASPAARRLARERGFAIAEIRGTGPRGRVTLSDVHGHAPAASAAPPASAVTLPPHLPSARRAIYRKMTEVALLPLAQVGSPARVDAVKALIDLRGDFGWTAFAVYAVARLLRDHVELRTDATTGAPFERIDVGVAADTPGGLIVPVVRDANALTLAEIQREIARLATAARDASLTAADIGGACFSVSNVGPQGVERVTPLPDPPQTAILGVGAVTQRAAVADDGALTAAWIQDCTVTFDHRFIDGAPAARFLAAYTRSCTDPALLL